MKGQSFTFDLQFHPFQGTNYRLLDILKIMEERHLNGLAFLSYKWDKTSLTIAAGEIDREVRENYEIEKVDERLTFFTNKESGVRLSIILGEEVAVLNQRWHILAIGVTGVKASTFGGIIEEILEKGGIPILDHPFADPQRKFRDIGEEKRKELAHFCQTYAGNIALEWNGYCLPRVRKFMPGYGNVNEEVEKLSKEFELPLVPTTDLHARNRQHLKAIGTCFIETFPGSIDLGDLLSSLRKNIFASKFWPQKNYVSFWHLVGALGFPLLFNSQKNMY